MKLGAFCRKRRKEGRRKGRKEPGDGRELEEMKGIREIKKELSPRATDAPINVRLE